MNNKTEIDPKVFFRNWIFPIPQHHWTTLGIIQVEHIDPIPTKALRLKKAVEYPDQSSSQITKKFKVMKRVYVNSGSLDLHEGDIFYCDDTKQTGLNIINPSNPLEVMSFVIGEKSGIGFHLKESEFLDWLKMGSLEKPINPIHKDQSRSELSKFYEYK